MIIKINGENKIVNNNINLSDFISEQLNGKDKGIAVAVNYKIVQKQDWNLYRINENDEIEIVHAVQGG